MSTDYIPGKDGDLLTWFNHFLNAASENKAALGLSDALLSELKDELTDYDSSLTNVNIMLHQYKASVVGKDTSRAAAIKTIRVAVRQIQGSPTVTPELKRLLGITPGDNVRVRHSPVTPKGLFATPFASGYNRLQWKANGNTPGTPYTIEAQTSGEPAFRYVDTTTRTRFDHTKQIPGVVVYYRVYATRNNIKSAPTEIVSVYSQVPRLLLTKVA